MGRWEAGYAILMGMELSKKRCIPCEGNVPPLTRPEAETLLAELQGWKLDDDAREIKKQYTFKDFDETMKFVNEIAKIAEEEAHHPDLDVSYGKLGVELTTHAIGGLSQNDFILAAKIDSIPRA